MWDVVFVVSGAVVVAVAIVVEGMKLGWVKKINIKEGELVGGIRS